MSLARGILRRDQDPLAIGRPRVIPVFYDTCPHPTQRYLRIGVESAAITAALIIGIRYSTVTTERTARTTEVSGESPASER